MMEHDKLWRKKMLEFKLQDKQKIRQVEDRFISQLVNQVNNQLFIQFVIHHVKQQRLCETVFCVSKLNSVISVTQVV